MMHPGEEVEAKPKVTSVRAPLSWGERVERRKKRQRSAHASVVFVVCSRLGKRVARLLRVLGITRRKEVVDGVVYLHRSQSSLRRSLSESGGGVKEYDVRFPSRGGVLKSPQYPVRETMRIRYTHQRIYRDLGQDPRVHFALLVADHIRPGCRVLEMGCGTGGASAIYADLSGPSGGVVSVHRDGESIRFARQRYRENHLAFELGWMETIDGELDGGFDAVIAVDLFRDAPDAPSKSRAVASLARVVGAEGLILVICPDRSDKESLIDRLAGEGIEKITELGSDPTHQWTAVMGFKERG
jgi:2-polyprenyl-3-methyl-5-hydroxy-6-metoxy-1,4-benzoquinol methylase